MKGHNIDDDELVFSKIHEVQSFDADSKIIWTVKISNDRKYIATGGMSRLLKIFIILEDSYNSVNFSSSIIKSNTSNSPIIPFSNKEQINVFKLFNETAFREFKGHQNDIIDISWGVNVNIELN